MSSNRVAAVAALLLAAACSDTLAPPAQPGVRSDGGAPVYYATGENAVAGRFIVVTTSLADARLVARAAGVTPLAEYGDATAGFVARLDEVSLARVRMLVGVRFIEQDQRQRLDAVVLPSDPYAWGLDRIDQRSLPLSGTYSATATGAGVNVYVIGTGIQKGHPQFKTSTGSRAVSVFDVTGSGGVDCYGAGTASASIAAGKTFGVAPAARIKSLRITDCNGTYYTSDAITAVNYVSAHGVKPAVVLFIGSGPFSKALNLAVDALSRKNYPVVTAGGNSYDDACAYSPASALGALAVAASDMNDGRWASSNYGRCIGLYAPGVSVGAATIGSVYSSWTGTGTAASHVAGVAALYLQNHRTATPATLANAVWANATKGKITNNDSYDWMYATPNLLLYKGTL